MQAERHCTQTLLTTVTYQCKPHSIMDILMILLVIQYIVSNKSTNRFYFIVHSDLGCICEQWASISFSMGSLQFSSVSGQEHETFYWVTVNRDRKQDTLKYQVLWTIMMRRFIMVYTCLNVNEAKIFSFHIALKSDTKNSIVQGVIILLLIYLSYLYIYVV